MTISGKAKVAGVIGWPVAHSRSPRLHGWWLDHYRIDGAYVPLAVRPENFAAAFRALPKLGFAGANITLPHKEAALALVDQADDGARRIGAVNTMLVAPDGRMLGSNSDAFGFMESLRAGAPGWRAADGPAVVVGAGGAARAVVVALLDAGAPEVVVLNRTRARAEAMAVNLGGPIRIESWSDRTMALAGAGLLVNTTSLGMEGQEPLDLDLDRLPSDAVVTDAVYTPLLTPLLAAAAARGNRIVDGLGMLLHQARPGFAAWFGVAPEVTPALRDHVLAGLGG